MGDFIVTSYQNRPFEEIYDLYKAQIENESGTLQYDCWSDPHQPLVEDRQAGEEASNVQEKTSRND